MKPPKNLTDKSTAIWQDVRKLSERKLSALDYTLIENFCREVDLYDQAVAEIDENGLTNSHDQIAAAVTVRNKAATNIRQMYKQISPFLKVEAEFGLDKFKRNAKKKF
jgi:P27 family predicted phage terminase small subunit